MSVVDTCFLIDLIREDPGAIRFAEEAPLLSTTSISAAEFLYGARLSIQPGVIEAARGFLAHFSILPFDGDAAFLYAEIAADLRHRGGMIASFDELIAATVLRHDETLVSRDRHFTAIHGLDVISY